MKIHNYSPNKGCWIFQLCFTHKHFTLFFIKNKHYRRIYIELDTFQSGLIKYYIRWVIDLV